MQDARRAAEELVRAGVGKVLLFGSVARGDATSSSDIDLVAICDDLGDYRQRHEVQKKLQQRIRGVAGWPVDVFVTDAPEWAVRTRRVPCSFEAGIAATAIRVADSGEQGPINWGKKIGMPDSPHAEMESRFGNICQAISNVTQNLTPTAEETKAAETGDYVEHARLEMERFARVCAAVHQTFEATAKMMMVVTTGEPAPYTHHIHELLAPLHSWVADTFEAVSVGVDLTQLHRWHIASNYDSLRTIDGYDETYLRLHVEAALRLARFAGQQGRQHNVAADLIRSLDFRLQNCEDAREQPQRIPVELPDGGFGGMIYSGGNDNLDGIRNAPRSWSHTPIGVLGLT